MGKDIRRAKGRAKLAVSGARPQSKGQREVKRLRGREREEIKRRGRESERDSDGGRGGWKETPRWGRVRGEGYWGPGPRSS